MARYDPVGLRTVMTTSWTAFEKELAKHRPNHLPQTAAFVLPLARDAEVAAAEAAQGIAAPAPRRHKFMQQAAYDQRDLW